MEKRYGLTKERWEVIKEEIRDFLVETASNREFVTYSDLSESLKTYQFNPNSKPFHEMLGEISIQEHGRGRGMLSVVVVSKEGDFTPGQGFFKLAEELGEEVSDKLLFWQTELKKVHDYWGK